MQGNKAVYNMKCIIWSLFQCIPTVTTEYCKGPLKSASPSYGFSFSPSQNIPLVYLVIHGMSLFR